MLVEEWHAVVREVSQHGTDDDKDFLQQILDGTLEDKDGNCKTLDEILAHPSAQRAELKRHHVLALRLYTTPFFERINDPLRKEQHPHPFAATVLFIADGIEKLRTIHADGADANVLRVFWRGLKDLDVDAAFMQKGGTELACLSATASPEVAAGFANSTTPLLVKVESRHFMNRGADIAFLSTYPKESEFIYPPLTYLVPKKKQKEIVGGLESMVVTVEPVFP